MQTCCFRGIGEGGEDVRGRLHPAECGQRGVGICDGGPCRRAAFRSVGEGVEEARGRFHPAEWPTRCGRLRRRPMLPSGVPWDTLGAPWGHMGYLGPHELAKDLLGPCWP